MSTQVINEEHQGM